ncbi:hypothetical protein RUM43_009447 [Polyplax serrata]|uniref:Uncharacterized protein n=1 Tax=Polyplax serrata TaxID=468196 RepID=A0AAN8NVG0_POLSC
MKSHYRGHKMSLWLNLIPQLHRPGVDDLNMRHHHFQEESAQFYDGSVRPQSLQRPSFVMTATASTTPATTLTSVETPLSTPKDYPTTTECPPNVTGSAVSQNTIRPASDNDGSNNNHNLFRKLASSHYQSYTTALTVTIAVGCFLLLLNILIFAGIYHQRDRNGHGTFDDKKKDEMMEVESYSSSSGDVEATKQALAGHHKLSAERGMEISLQEFKSSPPSGLKKPNCTNPLPPSYDPPPDPMKMHRRLSGSILYSPSIPEPPPPPKNQPPILLSGGILIQQGAPQTPGCPKKRVQIQEISV